MPRLRRREFLMLPRVYDLEKHTVGGYYISEKLEGVRVFWDGGISRGIPIPAVPWANTRNPDSRQPASGLWSRHANSIIPPDWFLNLLPCMPLDGVLWAGRGQRSTACSVCRGGKSEAWEQIEFAVFSTPPIDKMFSDGIIKNNYTSLRFQGVNTDQWIHARNPSMADDWYRLVSKGTKITFDAELAVLRESLPFEGQIYLHQQKRLPYSVKDAARRTETELTRVRKLGGVGVMLRDPQSCWEPTRASTFLEYT